MYISIFSETYTTSITAGRFDSAARMIKEITLANEVSKALEGGDYEVQWLQSSTTDGTNVYTTITAIVSSKK